MEISNSREDIARVGEGHRQGWMSMVKTTSSHKEKKVTELECILFFGDEFHGGKGFQLLFVSRICCVFISGWGRKCGVVVWLGSFKCRGKFGTLLKYRMKDRTKAYK